MNKQVIITAIILTLFALIGGGLVSYTEQSTAAQIQINEKLALQNSLKNILPATAYNNDLTSSFKTLPADNLLGTKKESTVYIAKLNNKTSAFIFSPIAPNGYNGKIHLLVGIYADGSIAGTSAVKHRETPGLGDAIEERRSDWIHSFKDQSLETLTEKQWKVKRDGGHFDQFTGATITPRAVVKAVHNSLLYFKQHKDLLMKSAGQSTTRE